MATEFHTIGELVRDFLDNQTAIRKSAMLGRADSEAESELEHLFWHYVRKTDWDRWDSVDGQVPCCGYRLDSVLVGNGRKVCIELDGKEFHQDRLKDDRRDEAVLNSGVVDEVIRLPFPTIYYYAHPTFAVLAIWHRWLEISQEHSTFTREEAAEEMKIVRGIDDCYARKDATEYLEKDADVWWVENESTAFSMSFLAWRDKHHVQPIRRLTREQLLSRPRRRGPVRIV
jgi:very-short-patch-repair endonuclease